MPKSPLAPIFAAILLLLTAAPPTRAEPLFFDAEALRAAVREPGAARLWKSVEAKAEALVNPGSRRYLDPESLSEVPKNHSGFPLVGRRHLPEIWTLGVAYAVTGDERFAAHGWRMLEEVAKTFPHGHPATQGLAGKRGDIIFFLALGYDFFERAMPEARRELVAAVLAEYCDAMVAEATGQKGPDFSFTDKVHDLTINPDLVFREFPKWRNVSLYVPWHNYSGVTMGPVGLASLTLRDKYPERSSEWERSARWVLEQWFAEGVGPEGAYMEGQGYIFYGLDRSMPFLKAVERLGLEPVDLGNLPRFPDFWATMLLPGKPYVEDRNDDNFGRSDVNMLALGEMLGSPLAIWLYEETSEKHELYQRLVYGLGPKPVPEGPVEAGVALSTFFTGRGLVVARSGWEPLDSMFSIEAGPYFHVTHSQSDKGHFNFYSLGRRWAVDSSYGRQASEDHSLVFIDGQGQAPGRNTDGTFAEVTDYREGTGWVYAKADLTQAYTETLSGKPGPAPETATRETVYVRERSGRPAYALVFDDVYKSGGPRNYTYRLHTSGGFLPEATNGGAVLNAADGSAAFVSTPDANQGRAVARFRVPRDGRYRLFAMVRPGPGLENSFFIGTGESEPEAWQFRPIPVTRWESIRTASRPDGVFELEAGEQRIAFAGRERGSQLHAVALVPLDVDGSSPLTTDLRLMAEDLLLTGPMRLASEKQELPAVRGRFYIDGEGTRGEPDFALRNENVLCRFPFEGERPRFVSGILPSVEGGPEGRMEVTRTEDGALVTVQYGAWKDRFLWHRNGGVSVELSE